MASTKLLSEIDTITTDFRRDIVRPDGSRVLHERHIEYQKTIHFDIPHMKYDVLCEIPRYLIRTSVFPNGARYGNADQYVFWLWLAEVSSFHDWDFEYRDNRFQDLFGLLISSFFFDVGGITMPRNYHFARFIGNFHILPSCFSFPFLERCIRFKSHEYVSPNGVVLKDFNLPRYGRSDRSYRIGQPPISNISHGLKLLYYHVASSHYQNIMDRFMNELNEVSGLRISEVVNLKQR